MIACVLFFAAASLSPAATEPLRLDVPAYREVSTHIHRPENLKPGEKLPGVLIVGGPGCKLAAALAETQRLIAIHYSPAENLPTEFRGWEERLGHAGQDVVHLVLKRLFSLSEVDTQNAGIVTFSFGVVGATGALARHPDLAVKFLIDWEGPSGPQNLRWVPPGHKIVRNHPASDEAFWKERTASEFIKKVRCRYLRVQSETDHVQVLGQNQHAIEMLNNATRGLCPWTRCNDNPPNIAYDEKRPENEKSKWLPGKPSPGVMDKLVVKYVEEMIRMAPLPAKESAVARHARVAERRAGPVVIVHRGAWAFAPENSLAAYAAAMDYGADGCEVDLRRTRDGVLVLFHDDMLDRLTCGFGAVNELTHHELLALRPQRQFGRALYSGAPTFTALLNLARQRAMLLHLDVKEPGLEDDIARQLEEADAWDHVVSINTYNTARLRQHPKLKLLKYKGPGLSEQRRDMDPVAVQAQLARPGQMIMVDDPRVAARVLKREPKPPAPLHLTETARQENPSSVEARVLDADKARIVERARVAQQFAELGAKSPRVVAALEEMVRNPSAHEDWHYHGLDAAIAARALGQLGATESVPVLLEAFRRTEPATNNLAGFRAKMYILPALGDLRCAESKQFLLEYVARASDPPQFEDATQALLCQELTDAELVAVLRSANPAVRGTAILECVDRPTAQRRLALQTAAPWALELPRQTSGG